MKKRILAMLLAVATVLGLVACGSGTSSSDAESSSAFTPRMDSSEEVTINIVGPLNNFEALEAGISDFEEIYPNCQVLYSYLDTNMVGSRLSSDPTLNIFMQNSYRYQNWEDTSYFADLQQEDIDLSAVRDTAISSSTVDGKLFGLPVVQDTSGLIVNVDLLTNAGLEVPTNYSELLEVCQALKEQGYVPLQGFDSYTDGYSYLDKLLVDGMFHALIIEKLDAGEDLTALYEGQAGSADFLQEVFDRFAALIEGGYIDAELNKELYPDNYNGAILQFFEGEAPFLVATTETYSGTKKRESKSEAYTANSFEYKFICTPLADNGAYTYMENWWVFCLNDKCENKEWAVEFLRFLATEEQLNQLASIKGLPTAAKNSTDERYADIYPEDESLLYYESYVIPPSVEDALSTTLEEMRAGDIALSGAAAELERILREGE